MSFVTPEFSQAEVDWEEYQSQLVPCAKCKRKFHPLRIKKHESCCKGERTSIKCFDRVSLTMRNNFY